jgi:carbamoyl-phosphate synthase large subunit
VTAANHREQANRSARHTLGNVLTEGVGSPAWGTLLPLMQQTAEAVVALDIDPLASGLYLADRGLLVPPYSDADCFDALCAVCRRENISVVVPTINEGLLNWAEKAGEFAAAGTTVIVSPPETVAVCVDKWRTYQFFRENDIPTPPTSLQADHDLLKPRVGRGGAGIRRLTPADHSLCMDGYITQKLLRGREYSIDALCDLNGQPLYIVPRERLSVESGLSVRGRTAAHPDMERHAARILSSAHFRGPINIQCFDTSEGVFFTEINPRLAGGMSLSMAATENWFDVLARLIGGGPVRPVEIRRGMVMMRYYADCFRQESELVTR